MPPLMVCWRMPLPILIHTLVLQYPPPAPKCQPKSSTRVTPGRTRQPTTFRLGDWQPCSSKTSRHWLTKSQRKCVLPGQRDSPEGPVVLNCLRKHRLPRALLDWSEQGRASAGASQRARMERNTSPYFCNGRLSMSKGLKEIQGSHTCRRRNHQ